MSVRLIKFVLLAAATLSTCSENASADVLTGGGGLLMPEVLIDFVVAPADPAITDNTILTSEFAGIELSGFRYNITDLADASPTGGEPSIKNFSGSDITAADIQSVMSIQFDEDVTDFATSWLASNNNSFELSAYLDGNLVTDQFQTVTASQKYGFVNSLFNEVRIVNTGTPGTLLILDDFQFNLAASAVPEPSSFALLAIAAGAVIRRNLRRK